MELKLELGRLEATEGTSLTDMKSAVEKASQEAIRDYFKDQELELILDHAIVTDDDPQNDGDIAVATIVVTAILTGAASTVGKIAVEEVVAAIKRYLKRRYPDKVEPPAQG